jgi:hypothetical protein
MRVIVVLTPYAGYWQWRISADCRRMARHHAIGSATGRCGTIRIMLGIRTVRL